MFRLWTVRDAYFYLFVTVVLAVVYCIVILYCVEFLSCRWAAAMENNDLEIYMIVTT